MALKNRLGTAIYSFDGDSIKLQSNLDNLRGLEQDSGSDFYQFLDSCETPQALAKLFYHMQIETDYTEQEIYAAFFADIGVFQQEETQKQLQEIIYVLMGFDKQDMLKPAGVTEKKKPA